MSNAVPNGTVPLSMQRAINNRVELLETRTLLSSSINAAGWTVVTPPAGARIIYCSSSTGSDSNTGLSPSSPVRTLVRGESLLRNKSGDELLLKAGDTFYGNFIFWTKSGESAQNPIVFGSYGTGARPQMMTGTKDGLETGKISAREVDYLDILGINFIANGRDPNLTKKPATNTNPAGINLLTKSNGIVIENCEFQYYTIGINVQDYLGPVQNVSIRRNIIINSYAVNAHSQGLYATGVHNLTIEGNDFDRNGYNAQVGARPTVFNQDCYLAYDDTNCVVTDNIFARAAATGLEARAGGIVENNTFIDDPVGMTFGLVNGARTTAGGVTGVVSGNVFIGGGNTGNLPEGQGLEIGNIRAGAGVMVTNNIFSHGGDNSAPAIMIAAGKSQIDPQNSVGANNITVASNVIYDWSTGIDVVSGLTPGGKGITALNNLTLSNNDFEYLTGPTIENHSGSYLSQEHISGNQYYHAAYWVTANKVVKPHGTTLGTPISFPAAGRTVEQYDASLGYAGTANDFYARAAAQTVATWNSKLGGAALSAYIEQGFGLKGGVTTGSGGSTGSGDSNGGSGSSGGSSGSGSTGAARKATTTFQAVNYDASVGVKPVGGDLGYADNGDWAEYKQVDFGTGVSSFTAKVSGLAQYVGSIQVRLDSPTGKLVGTLKVAATGSWNTYLAQTAAISGATGVHNLYLVFVGHYGIANVQSFAFATSNAVVTTRSAKSTIPALSYNAESGIASDHYSGIGTNGGNWVEYSQVDFGTGATKFQAEIAALAKYAGRVEIRLDSPTGTRIGSLKVAGTGAWNRYEMQSTAVTKTTGIHKLYLVFVGGKAVGNIESFSFA